jgi:hypothetical protein
MDFSSKFYDVFNCNKQQKIVDDDDSEEDAE